MKHDIFMVMFNDLNEGKAAYRDINIQATPCMVEENFSPLGLEMDLITTLEQFHDPKVIHKYEMAIYHDSTLYNTPFTLLNNNDFLYDYIDRNFKR